jgi:hypothetical protein
MKTIQPYLIPLPSCYRALIRHIIIFYERVRSADAKSTRFDPAATAAPKIPSRFVSFRFEFHDPLSLPLNGSPRKPFRATPELIIRTPYQ